MSRERSGILFILNRRRSPPPGVSHSPCEGTLGQEWYKRCRPRHRRPFGMSTSLTPFSKTMSSHDDAVLARVPPLPAKATDLTPLATRARRLEARVSACVRPVWEM